MLIPRLYFLKDDEQLYIRAFTRQFVVNGPRPYFTPPLWHAKRRRAETLGPTEYLLIRNTLTGELRNVIGPQLFFLNADETILQRRHAITLKKNEYVRLIDNDSGDERIVRGETTVYLEPTEEQLGEVKKGINVDEERAVLVRNRRSGQQSLFTERQVFIPTVDQEIVEIRPRIKLEDNEAVITKNENGRFQFHYGGADAKQFFLQPHHELVELHWSSGIQKDQRNLAISKFDLRPKFMWYEFEARTQDNVELVLGVTFFWEIDDLQKMIATTDDTSGDICSHARSAIIQAISQVTLEQFLAAFNNIIHTTILDGDLSFFEQRGVQLHAVEVRSVESKDESTQKVLQEIINETTNRINRLQKQESQNEVKLMQMQGEIEVEGQRAALLELRREHAQIEGTINGELEALRVRTFLDSLGDNISVGDKIALFSSLRQQEALKQLGEGNAQLYLTPADVDLTIRTNA